MAICQPGRKLNHAAWSDCLRLLARAIGGFAGSVSRARSACLVLCGLCLWHPPWTSARPALGESLEVNRDTLMRRARVVEVYDPLATHSFDPDPDRVQGMVDTGLKALCGKRSVMEVWRSLLSTQDIVGIKVVSSPGAISGTRPAVVAALVQGLLEAGIPAGNLVIWDRRLSSLRQAGWVALAKRYGIRAAGSEDEGYDDKTFYDTPLIGQLVWGDHEFGRKGDGVGRKSFVSKLVTQQITKIINVTPLFNHDTAGVTGNLYSLASGSVDNMLRFEGSAHRLATAIPEIYALPALGDRVVLNIVDALICQYQGEQREMLHYSSVLNQIRFSTDPVALDVLSIHELDHQRQQARITSEKTDLELYRNASLLELGVSDVQQILVEKVSLAKP